MNDNACVCQFCLDYERFQVVLPLVPEKHREWFESIFDALWNTQEELSYKKAILDGSWPEAIEILEHHLTNAKAKANANIYATPAQVASAELDLNFDCKVCEKCNKAMTAREYWNHECEDQGFVAQPEDDHVCDVVDISDGPCGDPSHDKLPPSVFKPNYGPCDECNEGVMIERKNRQTGYSFLGCSDFPDCKHTTAGGSNPQPESDHHYDYDYCNDDDELIHGDHLGDFF